MKVTLSIIVVTMTLVCPVGVQAVFTPYASEPAAFNTTNGLVWDFELGQMLAAEHIASQTVLLASHCHSGGMLVESGAAFAASSCSWNEYARTDARWDDIVWEQLRVGKTYLDAALTAFNTPILRDLQRPQMYGTAGSLWTAEYRAGDRAILFTGANEARFNYDVSFARTVLTQYKGWPAGAVTTILNGGSKTELQNALSSAASNMNPDSRLILYIRDHGTSTDVIKSRLETTYYHYQTDVSLWRPDDNDDDGSDNPFIYGITDLYIKGYAADGYFGWVDPMESWDHIVEIKEEGIFLHWFSTDKNNPDTWLRSGTDYDFGFHHYAPPTKSSWYNIRFNDSKQNDYGIVDGSEWGGGKYVFSQTAFDPAGDINKWPGWANGGDGWVLVPIPEPHPLVLLSSGVVLLAFMLRRNQSRAL